MGRVPADRPPHGPDHPSEGEGDDDPDKSDGSGERADRPQNPPERGRTRYSWRDFELANDEDTPPDGPDDQPDQDPDRTEHSETDETGDGEAVERASGWDHPDVVGHPDRPDLDELHFPDKHREHIIKNHMSGAQKADKTEFPGEWDEDTIVYTVLDVARNPTETPWQQKRSGLWVVDGERNGVTVRAIVRPDGGIITGYPLSGDGVVRNPRKDQA